MPLPLADRIRVAYSSFELWFGLLFLVAGAFVVSPSGWRSIYFYLGPVATVTGRISTTYSTSYLVDERAVRGFTFRYPARGLEWAGTSFSTDSALQPGQAAPVEYCARQPAISRLASSSLAPLGIGGLIGGLVFVLAGLYLMLKSAWHTRKLLVIAADAGVAEASRPASRQQTAHTNDADYTDDAEFEFRFTYVVNYQHRTLLVYAATPQYYHERELVIFERANPSNALLLSALPRFLQAKLTTHG